MALRSALVFALALALHAPLAVGQTQAGVDPDEARYQQAQQLRGSDPDAAMVIYQEILARAGTPRARAQVALLDAQRGRWVAAEESLSAAIATQGDPWVEPRRAALEANLEAIREHLSTLVVTTNVRGARLRVDGVDAGTLPMTRPVRVARGALVLDLGADDYEPSRQHVEATSAHTHLDVTLVRRVAAQPPPPARSSLLLPPVAPPPRGSDLRTVRTLGIASLALGAVGVALGGVGLGLRNRSVDEFTAGECWLQGERVRSLAQGSACQDSYDTGTAMGALGLAGFVAGGVLLVTGAVLTVAAAVSGSSRRASVGCAVLPGAIGCGGTF